MSVGFEPESGRFTYLLGDVISAVGELPPGVKAYEIPAGKYAKFPVRPRLGAAWGFAIVSAKRRAYLDWLPQSEYEPAGTIDDFEWHDERSVARRSPEVDLFVAIKERQPIE